MRIRVLSIPRFKNLENFRIEFNDELVTVLVGENGAGKSNLLEALISIFRNLDLGEPPEFQYQIEYTCNGFDVKVDADPSRERGRLSITVNGETIPASDVKARRTYLPRHTFGYYSGSSQRFEALFTTHQKKFLQYLLKAQSPRDEGRLRPLFLARPVHSNFVLLSFFTEDDPGARIFLENYLGITGYHSVAFILRKPSWARRGARVDEFWGAAGAVRFFLDKLAEVAGERVDFHIPVEDQVGRRKQREGTAFTISTESQLRELAEFFGSRQAFFRALESTYVSDLIHEVRIRVRARTEDGTMTFRELSEGEQQLLSVLGLMRFTRDADSLFLLDEPDTHLNPAWGLHYLPLVEQIAGPDSTSQVLMTTHDPMVVSALRREQVRVLHRQGRRVVATTPREDPKGMGVAAILTSELFGLRSTLDLETLEKLDEKRDLEVKAELTPEEAAKLIHLAEELGPIDMAAVVRDPMYRAFNQAMVAYLKDRGMWDTHLSPEERDEQDEAARDIVARLMATREEGQ